MIIVEADGVSEGEGSVGSDGLTSTSMRSMRFSGLGRGSPPTVFMMLPGGRDEELVAAFEPPKPRWS